jgi:hypothetical protein
MAYRSPPSVLYRLSRRPAARWTAARRRDLSLLVRSTRPCSPAASSPLGPRPSASHWRSLEAHRDRRDELERRLVAAGRLVAAEPAYDLGKSPVTPAQLNALAARVEDGLAGVAFRTVTRAAGVVRQEAAADLLRAARRGATWRGTVVALPGMPL